MKLSKPLYVVCSYLVTTAGLLAQRQPDTANVNMYFPMLADGGQKTDQFQSTITFVNTSAVPANVSVYFFNPDGSPWSLDLGSGPQAKYQVTVPPSGTRFLTSGIGKTTAVGWASAFSNAAVQGVVSIREISNGYNLQQFMIEPVLPTLDYVWPGDKNSLVSIANPSSGNSIAVEVGVLDPDGNLIGGTVQLTLGPNQETLFRVGDEFPAAGGTSGAIAVSGVNRPGDIFVATSLAGDGTGVLSSLPNGGYTWPISHWDRIWLVFWQVSNAAVSNGVLASAPALQILGGQDVNAFAQNGSTVSVTLGLSQLISDSPSELAFALAHELGHIFQQQNNGTLLFNSDPEFDADVWGTLISLIAGYDPYAAAGTLAKLSMATGTAGLTTQFEAQLSSDAHKSFNARLDNVFADLVLVCNSSDALNQACAYYKGVVHPNLPPIAPLVQKSPFAMVPRR